MIGNLRKNIQKIYSKNLRRLVRKTDLNQPVKVEQFVFGLDVTFKYRNALFDAYTHYCEANEIERERMNGFRVMFGFGVKFYHTHTENP